MNQSEERLQQLFSITKKESQHLRAVSQRLQIVLPKTEEELRQQLDDPLLIDTLESFTAKFSRMQDTIADKLLPVFLTSAGENTGTVIENLNRAEKLSLISDTQQWLVARGLRNKLVHEYIDDLQELLEAVELAQQFVTELVHSYEAIQTYTKKHLNIQEP